MGKRALVLGATGLVGTEIVDLLIGDATVEKVTTIVRRPLGRTSAKVDQQILELDDLATRPELFRVDHVYCALGTTIKKAGSEERFRKIDLEFPLDAAKLGLQNGATNYLLVSSIGADAGSRIFYSRVKGELEDRLAALGYRSVTIARPALLLGDRKEHRRGEEIAKKFGWLMPPAYKPIHARTVARALVDAAHRDEAGLLILESRQMRSRFA